MHVQQSLGPSTFVQIVDVLRDDQQFARPFSIEPRQHEMSGVRLDLAQPRATGIVELMHQFGIARERLRGRNILDPVPFPQAVGGAKRRQSALRADPRAG